MERTPQIEYTGNRSTVQKVSIHDHDTFYAGINAMIPKIKSGELKVKKARYKTKEPKARKKVERKPIEGPWLDLKKHIRSKKVGSSINLRRTGHKLSQNHNTIKGYFFLLQGGGYLGQAEKGSYEILIHPTENLTTHQLKSL